MKGKWKRPASVTPVLADEESDLGPPQSGRRFLQPPTNVVVGDTKCEECSDVGCGFDDDGRYLCGQCLFETMAMKEI